MLNYDFVLKKAVESKIDEQTIEREYWQLLLLSRMYGIKGSEKIYFKGGTAIRFLLNSFRFSEDMDFTSELPKSKAEDLILEVFNFFKKNSSEGVAYKKERVFEKFEKDSLKYRFLFTPYKSKQMVSVRLDVSFREKPLQVKQKILVPFDYPVAPYPLVSYLGEEEIMAEKVRALLVRGKPRDFFDFWFLLTKGIKVNEAMIVKKLKIYPKIKFSKEKLTKAVFSYNDGELKKDLNQFLPINYRNFYKDLKGETLKLLVVKYE